MAQQALAAAIARRTDTAAELHSSEARLAQLQAEQRSAAEADTVSATELLARQAFMERVEAQRGAHACELQARDAEVADSDAKLAVAATEHEMLNRLRERHRGQHERETARREQGMIDEIAGRRAGGSAP